MSAEIYCKKCLHHDVLPRPARVGDVCPQCGALGLFTRVMRVGPLTHFPSVLRAIFSLRGVFFLIAFAMIGTIPIGPLAAASILLLYLGGLRLALKSMQVERKVDDKGKPTFPPTTTRIEFPEVSPEELFDKSSLLPALLFVFVFVWAPPILIGYAATGLVTIDPASLITSPPAKDAKDAAPADANAAAAAEEKAIADTMKMLGIDDPELAAQTKAQLKAETAKARETIAPASHDKPHLDAPRVASGLLGLLLFLWSPMAIVLFLRNPSVVTMFHAPAGLATLFNDPLGYLTLSLFVLPAIAARFGADVLTAVGPFLATPAILWVKGAIVLFAWGICGLYVRKRARAFDLPVDDADWQPLV